MTQRPRSFSSALNNRWGVFLTLLLGLLCAVLPMGAAKPEHRTLYGDPVLDLPAGDGSLLVISGNEKGFIRPCGCSKPKLGGVHRRATILKELRSKKSDLGLVSTGNLVVSGARQQRMKFEHFLISMGAMGYQGLALGPGELLLGVDWLLESKDMGGFPLIAHNLRRDGVPLFSTSVKIEGTPYLYSGVLPPSLKVEGAEITALAPSLKELAAELDATHGQLLLFFGGAIKDLGEVIAAIPVEVRPKTTLLVSGDDPLTLPARDGVDRVIAIGSKGRHLHYVREGTGKNWFEAFVLVEKIKEDEDVSAILEGYRELVKDEELAAKAPRRPTKEVFAGEASCVACHEATCTALDDTPHEAAFQSLVETNDHFDPECVACHVTGFDLVGGYVSPTATPQFKNVQCEACHGPSAAHVANSEVKTPGGKLSKLFCQKCHDPDNSPQFDFDEYWPIIEHPVK